MLKLSDLMVPASTYLPLAFGAVIAGGANLAFVSRVQLPKEESGLDSSLWIGRRQIAMRLICGTYVGLSGAFLIVAVVLGGTGFILTATLLVVLSVCALLLFWSKDE